MIVYHYSQTLKEGDTLEPGHCRFMSLCEPFIQALEHSGDCFYGMVLTAKYMFAVMDRSHLREWSDFAKWATEGLFEYVRKNEYPQCVSRLRCNYFCADLADCIRMYREDWGEEDEEEREKVRLFEVEVPESSLEKRSISVFDAAYDAMREKQDTDTAFACARRYFEGDGDGEPNWEYLSAENAVAVKDISHLLRGENAGEQETKAPPL